MNRSNQTMLGALLLAVFFAGVAPETYGDGFVYSNGVFAPISVPGATWTGVYAVNNAGDIAGSYTGGGCSYGSCGFVDTGGVFTTVNYPGASTGILGINDSGQLVVDSSSGYFLDIGGVFTRIEVPGSYWTSAFGINDSGQIVGGYDGAGCPPSSFDCGFLDTGGAFTTILPSDARATYAYGINNEGQIVGDYNTDRWGDCGPSYIDCGFLYSEGNFTQIMFPGPGGGCTAPAAINDAGQVVGTYNCAPGDISRGFLDNGGVYTSISVSSLSWTQVWGINDSGQIVGNWGPANTPEPGTLALLGTGIIGLAGTLRRRIRRQK